jgi:hypothetical protein
MSKICAVCGKKAGILSSNVKDGKICLDCWDSAKKNYKSVGDFHSEFFTAAEIKDIIEHPEHVASYQEKSADRDKCIICKSPKDAIYKTSDGYYVCTSCAKRALSINHYDYTSALNWDKFIKNHDSAFLKENLDLSQFDYYAVNDKGGLDLEIFINYKTQTIAVNDNAFHITGGRPVEDFLIKFSSIIKLETNDNTYEVTVGKKGHPIARAIVGNALFGSTGAIVGAVSARDTRQLKTKKDGYIFNIYYLSSTDNKTIRSFNLKLSTYEKALEFQRLFEKIVDFNSEEAGNEKSDDAKTISSHDYIEELKQLKELLDSGIITNEEFENKKKQILNS